MPPVIIAAVSAIGTAIGGAAGAFLIMNAAAIATGLMMAVGLGMSYAQQRKAQKQARDAYNAAQVDRLANVVSTMGPRELVLGRVTKGGYIAFRGSAGENKDRFLFHMVVASHPIDAFEQFFLNGEPVTLDGNGYVQEAPYRQTERVTQRQAAIGVGVPTDDGFGGTIYLPGSVVVTLDYVPLGGVVTVVGNEPTTGAFDQKIYSTTLDGQQLTILNTGQGDSLNISYQRTKINLYARLRSTLGSGTAVADARTKLLFPTQWTDDHRGQGLATIIAEFIYNETAFPSGIPVVTARIRGAKVYDPRSGLTAWSENPALLARHVYQHPQFGKADVSDDEDDRFIAAANACDIVHDYNIGAAVENRPLYVAALVAQLGAPAQEVLSDLAQAMAGRILFAGGELYIKAGVHTAPVMTLTDADLALTSRSDSGSNDGQIVIAAHRERAEKFNTVNLRIWDMGQDYKLVALTPLKGAALITRDGAELARELQLSAVPHAGQAQHIAGVYMRDARDPLTIEAPFKMTAYPIEMLDNVNLTLARYGWVNKTFAVLHRTWQHDRGIIQLTLKETTAAIYTPDAAFLPQGLTDNTRLARPWDIEEPVLGSITSGTGDLSLMSDGTVITRVRVTWAPLTDARVTQGGFIDVQWQPADGSRAWQTVTVDGAESEAYIVGARDLQYIVIRARSRSSVARSDWSLQKTHKVVGKTTPPSRVGTPLLATPSGTRMLLDWPDIPDADLAYYEVRLADADWGLPGYAYRGRASRVLLDPPSSVGQTRTWYVKAVDTGKRYSLLARSVAYERVAPPSPGTITWRVSDTSLTVAQITFNWADSSGGAFGLSQYKVVLTPPSGPVRTVYVKSSEWTTDYDWEGDATLSVRVIDRINGMGAESTVTKSKVGPNQVGTVRTAITGTKLKLDWDPVVKTSLPVLRYEVRTANSGWGTDGYLYRGYHTEYLLAAETLLADGDNTFWVKACDTDGRYSALARSVTYNKSAVTSPAPLTAIFSDTSTTESDVMLNWADSTSPFDLLYYNVTVTRPAPAPVQTFRTRASSVRLRADWMGDATVQVQAKDRAGFFSAIASLVVSKLPPNQVGVVTASISGNRLMLDWAANTRTTLPTAGFEVRHTDTGWGTAGFVYRGMNSGCYINAETLLLNDNTWYVRAFDTDGKYSATSRVVTYNKSAVTTPGSLTATFADTSTTDSTVLLNWANSASPFEIAYYNVTLTLPNATVRTARLGASEWRTAANWVGVAVLSVTAKDKAGFFSVAATLNVTKSLPNNVGVVSKTVVRGDITLDWGDVAKTTLPVAGYEVRKVNSGWGTAGYAYRGAASKTPALRMTIGSNPYYVRAFDTDGNYSATSGTVSHVYDLPAMLSSVMAVRSGRDVVLTATGTAPSDLKHYEFRIKKGVSVGDVWTDGALEATVRSPAKTAVWRPTTLGTYRVSARMVDIEGNESAASASATIVISRLVI